MPTKQADPTMTLRMHMLRNARAGPFNASIEAAQCLCITGASGSGKSVLLRMLADMDPAEGELSLAGMDRRAMPASTWRQRVMLVPAQAGWWAPTVQEHFAEATLTNARQLADRLRLPSDIFERQVLRLSSGERQRLALIRALVTRPNALLLDEPTASLDQDSVTAVESLLAEELARGLILVLVTHDAAQAARMGQQTLHIVGGKAVAV
jgi:ABC-type iron transport system FetAB ATPase subunit